MLRQLFHKIQLQKLNNHTICIYISWKYFKYVEKNLKVKTYNFSNKSKNKKNKKKQEN